MDSGSIMILEDVEEPVIVCCSCSGRISARSTYFQAWIFRTSLAGRVGIPEIVVEDGTD